MPRPHPLVFFRQGLKSDSFYADELINIYLLRPIAAAFVWLIYPTSITPNQVTLFAVFLGFVSALLYFIGTPVAIACAGIFILLKDITDDADGQLARAKELYSRKGRFLDSIGDAAVSLAVFASITIVIFRVNPSLTTIIFGTLACLGITLRVSYHVYYQVAFLHGEERYGLNRTLETITEQDRNGDPTTLRLQQLFLLIYGWQDRLMLAIDRWCIGEHPDERLLPAWYGDRLGLRLSGLTGFGTELTLLAAFSWFGNLQLYVLLNLFLMNSLWLGSVLYRRFILSANIPRASDQ